MRHWSGTLTAACLIAASASAFAAPTVTPVAAPEAPWVSLDEIPMDAWFRSNAAIINPGIAKIYPLLGLKGEMPSIELVSITGSTADCKSPMDFGFYANENGHKTISLCELAFRELQFFAKQQARSHLINPAKISVEIRYEYFRDLINFFRIYSSGLITNAAPCPLEYYGFLRLNNHNKDECFNKSPIRQQYRDIFFRDGSILNLDLLAYYEKEYEVSGSTQQEKLAYLESAITTGMSLGSLYHVYLHELSHLLLNHSNAEGCQLYKEEAEADALAEKITTLLAEQSYLNQYGRFSFGIKTYHMLNIAELIEQSGLSSVESDKDVTEAMKQATRDIGVRRAVEVMNQFSNTPDFSAVSSKVAQEFDLTAMPDLSKAIAMLDNCET